MAHSSPMLASSQLKVMRKAADHGEDVGLPHWKQSASTQRDEAVEFCQLHFGSIAAGHLAISGSSPAYRNIWPQLLHGYRYGSFPC